MISKFASWNDYWRFTAAIKSGRRHIFDAETRNFLNAVGATSKSRLTTFPAERTLCRAQIAHDVRTEHAFDQDSQEEVAIADFAMPCSEERLRPFPDRAKEGRANPKGHPVFYAAMDDETAIAEVRPWKGAHVTVGYFKTTSSMRLVDCTRHARSMNQKSRFVYAMTDLMKGDPKMREESVWVEIEEAFAKPITPSDEHADYLPTQVIAEVFMDQGYDGFIFNSSVARGKNVVIFDLGRIEFFESCVAIINGLTLDYSIGSYDGIEMK